MYFCTRQGLIAKCLPSIGNSILNTIFLKKIFQSVFFGFNRGFFQAYKSKKHMLGDILVTGF